MAAANAQLQLAAEDQAHFLAVTAHELRTPVGVLKPARPTRSSAHWADSTRRSGGQLLEGMSADNSARRAARTHLLTPPASRRATRADA